ncbi:MAG: class I SAM-dependent methyltransferase [Thermoleophilia bacterium]|nr:class I SAM-dependent methyltransferase [Thermoleophilia bacterium]
MSKQNIAQWEEKFSTPEYQFGTAPNGFLVRENSRLKPQAKVLCIADGEGRNSIWLAEQGHRVHAVEAAMNAIEKARALALERGVTVKHEQVDLEDWEWPVEQYDAVVAIFIQFTDTVGRARMFAQMAAALRPSGVLLLEGYGPGQLAYGTGGPKSLDHLYAVDELRTAFPTLTVALLEEYDVKLDEGPRHRGMSSLVDLVAVKP